MTFLARILLLGFATGLRTTAGGTAVLFRQKHTLNGFFGSRGARIPAMMGVVIEVTLDKLPQTPSRLEKSGLWLRVVAGAIAAWLLARSSGKSPMLPAVIGAALALLGAKVGHDVRELLVKQYPGLAPAFAEDAVAFALAGWAGGFQRGSSSRQSDHLG